MGFDQKLFEFQLSCQHGYVTSVYGALGASTRPQPAPNLPPPPPIEPTIIAVPPNTGHDRKLTWDQPKPETEIERSIRLAREKAEAVQRAEEQRRVRQLNIITRKPSL